MKYWKHLQTISCAWGGRASDHNVLYAREVSFITEGDEVIVCDIHIYNITVNRKLRSNLQMLQIAIAGSTIYLI